VIDFELEGAPPLLLNARLHWRSKNRQRSDWQERVMEAVKPMTPPAPFERAFVRYTRYCGFQEPDYDNLVSSWKWIQDALVRAGILTDDRRADIETHYDWEKARPADKRVRVQVVPILHAADASALLGED